MAQHEVDKIKDNKYYDSFTADKARFKSEANTYNREEFMNLIDEIDKQSSRPGGQRFIKTFVNVSAPVRKKLQDIGFKVEALPASYGSSVTSKYQISW